MVANQSDLRSAVASQLPKFAKILRPLARVSEIISENFQNDPPHISCFMRLLWFIIVSVGRRFHFNLGAMGQAFPIVLLLLFNLGGYAAGGRWFT